MQTFWQDLRYGVRMLLKQKGITIVAVLSLALGIGANTALFSVVDAMLLKMLPVKEPERLVRWQLQRKLQHRPGDPATQHDFVPDAGFSANARSGKSLV